MAPRIVDREEKARQIIHHASVVFARKGYNATKIDDVATSAGIGKGTVYEYFNSKQDLFLAVFDAYIKQYFDALQAQTRRPSASAAEEIREAVRAACALAGQVEELFPLTFEFWAASASSQMRDRIGVMFREMYDRFRRFFSALIRRGILSGEFSRNVDVESTAAVLVGSFDGLFLQAWFDKEMDPMKAGLAFIDVFLRGLKAPASEPGTGGAHAPA